MKILKLIGIVLGALLVLLVVLSGGLHFFGQSRLNSGPDVTIAMVNVPDDADLVRGEHLARISSCNECHAANYGGRVLIDEAPIGYLPAPNLTSNGPVADYTDEDWAGAIRHGVTKDGRLMTIMPSHHYTHYGDDDLANLIAFFKSVDPADNDVGSRQIQFPGTIIFGVLAYNDWAVNQTDHASVGGHNAPEMAVTTEYGKYLVDITSCTSCHDDNLAGGVNAELLGPNITPGGDFGAWTLEEFALALQAGQTPDGRQLDPIKMPWANYAGMSEVEVEALYVYLSSLEALPDNPEP